MFGGQSVYGSIIHIFCGVARAHGRVIAMSSGQVLHRHAATQTATRESVTP